MNPFLSLSLSLMSSFLQVFNSMIPTIFLKTLHFCHPASICFIQVPSTFQKILVTLICVLNIYNEVNIYIACLFSVNPGILNKIFT